MADQARLGARIAIFSLAIGAFGIGVTEFATMGLLSHIAGAFDISIAHAGWAVSAYAFGVVVGAPAITVLAAGMERKTLLLLMAAVFTLGNAFVAGAPNFTVMVAARFVSGLPHGVFLGLGALVAAYLSPAGRQGTAMARVMLGLTVSNIAGVPLVAAIGAATSWRAAYGIITVIGLATFAAVAVFVPRAAQLPPTSMRAEVRTLKRPQVILTLIAGSIGFGGMFAVYTYIEPTMTQLAGFPAQAIPVILGVYGLGMTTGSFVGGWLTDRNIDRASLIGICTLLAVMLGIGLGAHIAAVALSALFVMGIGGTTFTTALQARLMRESPDAPSLTAAMNHAAFNFANGFGAILGSAVIAAGFGYRAPALAGAGLTVLGLMFALVAILSKRGHRQRTRVKLDG